MDRRKNIFGGSRSFPTLVVSKPTKAQRVSLALSKLCSDKIKENAESDSNGYYCKKKYNTLLDKALKEVVIKTLPRPKKLKRSEKKIKEPNSVEPVYSVNSPVELDILIEDVAQEDRVVEWTTPQLQALTGEYVEVEDGYEEPEIAYKSPSIHDIVTSPSKSDRQSTAGTDRQICDKINESEQLEPWILLDKTKEAEDQVHYENYRRESIIDVISNIGNGTSLPKETNPPVQLPPEIPKEVEKKPKRKSHKSKKKMPKVNLDKFAEFYVVNTKNDWSFF